MMANQSMIDSWQRGQNHYPQARYFTPGQQQTQYRTTERGRARQMDLLVVVHNDVPPVDVGQNRVDVIVNSGEHHRAAAHGNGHLVNRYDAQAGITDHTALYSDQDMARIYQGAARPPVSLRDRDGGGPPGAQIYSVRAQVRPNERGELVLDTSQQITPGSGASVYTLHDVQLGMERATERDRGMAVGTPVPPRTQQDPGLRPPPPPPGYEGPQYSQAGLAAARGPVHGYPSVPKPGEPGSRFNPTVRDRRGPSTPQIQNPDLIRSRDVPTAGASGRSSGGSGPSARTVGQVGLGGAQGAAAGLKMTAAIPHPAAKVVGAAGGAVIGGAMAAGGKNSKPSEVAAGREPHTKKGAPDDDQRLTGEQHRSNEPAQAKKLPTSQRIKDSKVGQAVQSEGFRNGAKRVGGEVVRDAAAEAARAKQNGSTNKGVAASAVKGAATGAARGIRSEMANSKSQAAARDGSQKSPNLADRLGKTVESTKAQPAQKSKPADQRPLSERYDYQFEQPEQPGGGEPQMGR